MTRTAGRTYARVAPDSLARTFGAQIHVASRHNVERLTTAATPQPAFNIVACCPSPKLFAFTRIQFRSCARSFACPGRRSATTIHTFVTSSLDAANAGNPAFEPCDARIVTSHREGKRQLSSRRSTTAMQRDQGRLGLRRVAPDRSTRSRSRQTTRVS